MGVHGLWRLIEPSGKPVPLETLENKVLAVDVSIWLHQAVKGFQDSKGASVPNAHLLGIYHRVCKLLYFKVKPVFVFDGGVPVLKKQTIAKRNQLKTKNESDAERLQKQLLKTLLQHSAISKVLSEEAKAAIIYPPKKSTRQHDMYILPASEHDSMVSSEEDNSSNSTSETTDSSPTKHWDVHTIDMTSVHFKNLPADVRHEMLSELKETRKQNSWGRLHELPKQSDDFAQYQMKRLLKRQAVQSALEDAEKEMGGHSLSLAELESLLKDHGITTTNDIGKRIASDENTRYLLIKDIKQAMEEARKQNLKTEAILKETNNTNREVMVTDHETPTVQNKGDLEFEKDLEEAIALSLQNEPSTSKSQIITTNSETKNIEFSFIENFNDADFESDSTEEVDDISVKKTFSSAHSYTTEYSGLTPNEIEKIINNEGKKSIENFSVKKKIQQKSDNVGINFSNNKTNVDVSLDMKSNAYCYPLEKSIEIINEVIGNHNDDIQTDANLKSNTGVNFTHKKTHRINKDVKLSIENKEVATFLKNGENCENDIEVMSDSGESSSSLEFLAVSEKLAISTSVDSKTDSKLKLTENDSLGELSIKELNSLNKNAFEILINPQALLEDDLFNDVFDEKPETKQKNVVDVDRTDLEIKQASIDVQDIIVDKILVQNCETPSKAERLKEKFNVSDIIKTEKEQILKSKESEVRKMDVENLSKETSSLPNKEKRQNEINQISVSEKPKLSLDQMKELKNNLQRERIELLVEKSTKERMASNITDQMYQEAQDLLELFGVPYIVAPMEAEAQCAFLDSIELTDGTITDDSDIWLFGGRTVYKNFFNPSKYVMEFRAENIKHHFKLTREQMILLALLVGSDYTTGIQGIGPVTALEVLAAFPPTQSKTFSLSHSELLSGLKEFRSWFVKGKTAGPGRTALKNKLKKVSFSDTFPSLQVVQAYLEPSVETSRENFSWGKPDFTGLKDFANEKFGWSLKKTEEILKPVIKKLEENQLQKSIKDYFKTKYKSSSQEIEKKMSKRVKTAIDMIGKTPDELISEEMETLSKANQTRTRQKKKKSDKNLGNIPSNENTNYSDITNQISEIEDKKISIKKTNTRNRTKKNEDIGNSSKYFISNTKIIDSNQTETSTPRQKRLRTKYDKPPVDTLNNLPATDNNSGEQPNLDNKDTNELVLYENIAIELKQRRQRKNMMSKKEDQWKKKETKPPKKDLLDNIPKDLDKDEEVQFLIATSSSSLKRIEEIDREIKNELEKDIKKTRMVNVHKKEVIHQKLRDKSDVLRNKLKAIEVFRKSKKGPGYVEKRKKDKELPKKDAGLSESSDDE